MRVLMILLCLAFVAPVWAAAPAGITLSPVTISLNAQRPADAVTLSNDTAEEKVFQAEVVSWSHENGVDRYAPTQELLVSPPMFRVSPGARQVVRVGAKARTTANSTHEKTYRLFLQEVPAMAPVASADAGGVALKLLMRFGLPIFIMPSVEQPESLLWQAKVIDSTHLRLSLTNNANRHVKVSDIQLKVVGQTLPVHGFAYVFAGETHVWELKPDTPLHTGVAQLSARTENGLIHDAITIVGP